MYLSFYELSEKPFGISADPRFLWRGEKHKEAFANLKYGLLEENGYVVLTGDVGTGKTTLVNALLETLDDSVLIANINHPTLNIIEFLQIIARSYDPSIDIADKAEFLFFLNSFLKRSYRAGKRVLLIIDEAHRLSKELLEEIRLLSNIEEAGNKLINIFFVGQNEFKDIIQWPECRALRQRITLFYDIEPLTENETQEYIAHRLKIAGADERIFTQKAIRQVHRFTKGYPRLINILCDRAMLTGYLQEQREIDTAIVKECTREMQFLQPVKSNIPFYQVGRKEVPRQSPAPGIQTIKAGHVLRIKHRWLLPMGFVGLLALIGTVMGINMNIRSSSDDVSAGPGAVDVAHQAKPSVSVATAERQESAKAVGVAVDKEPPTLKRESAKVLLNDSEEPPAQAPSTMADTDEAAAQQGPVQPSTVEVAAEAIEKGDLQLAIELLERHIQDDGGDDSAARKLYAKALVGRAEQLASSPESEALLRKAVEADPQNIDAQFDLGKLYTQSKNYALAIDAYRSVIGLNPQFTDAFFNLGFIYAATGMYGDAEKFFQRVVQLAPEYQDKALFNLALIQEKLGKKEECIENLHKAVVLRPENRRAQDYLKQLLGDEETKYQ